MPAHPKLTEEQRHFAVVLFAGFWQPKQVVKALKEEFDVQVSRQAVCAYSPKHNPKVAEKWRIIYDAARAKFIDDQDSIAVSHLSHRQAVRDRIVRAAEESGDHATVLEALDRAAKDQGGLFTAKRQIAVTGGIEAFLSRCAEEDDTEL